MRPRTSIERERQRAAKRLRIAHLELRKGRSRPVRAIAAQVREIDRQLRSQAGRTALVSRLEAS